jgi:transcriptional regulator with XRE-family HTH domain
MKKNSDTVDIQVIDFEAKEIKDFYAKVGRKVQQIRQKKGLTQLDLSYLVGFKSTSLISGAEASYGGVKFSIEHLYKIAKVLQVDIKEFFDFQEI